MHLQVADKISQGLLKIPGSGSIQSLLNAVGNPREMITQVFLTCTERSYHGGKAGFFKFFYFPHQYIQLLMTDNFAHYMKHYCFWQQHSLRSKGMLLLV